MRKPITILAMLAFIAVWIWAIATLGTYMTGLPGWAQMLFYIAAGTLWVIPLRPLLNWMNAAEPPEED
jgi:predicted membrane channel-forming protein YqfA (hemolysin III family)